MLSDLEAIIKADVIELIEAASKLGYVITVEQTPLEPLAMGHYQTEVKVRKARDKSNVHTN